MLETSPPNSRTYPGPRRRRPSRGLRIGLTLVLVAGLLVVLGVRYYGWCEGASGPRTPVAFTVEEGASGEDVANALHDRGVLRCATVSRWLLARRGQADEVRAGTYDLTTNMRPSEAFDIITKAPPPVPTV
ncbi:MAG TPA: endolytic transglycosylase MltG, partial [Actinomycetota bacterium]|nr:endolytic transglycosylase MltG [Actinomycetota bacterium]